MQQQQRAGSTEGGRTRTTRSIATKAAAVTGRIRRKDKVSTGEHRRRSRRNDRELKGPDSHSDSSLAAWLTVNGRTIPVREDRARENAETKRRTARDSRHKTVTAAAREFYAEATIGLHRPETDE
jgi:hypothetical protein